MKSGTKTFFLAFVNIYVYPDPLLSFYPNNVSCLVKQIGEPYITARLREEYKERSKPKPKQIVNTFKGEEEREAIEALGELDKRSKAIKNSQLGEVFAAESKREDAKRNRLTLPQIL